MRHGEYIQVDLVTSHAQAQALKDGEWYWWIIIMGCLPPKLKVTG